jgi:hypothetical protein
LNNEICFNCFFGTNIDGSEDVHTMKDVAGSDSLDDPEFWTSDITFRDSDTLLANVTQATSFS